jgi:phasin family protein
MATKPEQFNELQKKNLEAAMRLAQMSIESSQRIMELQVATAKSLFEEGVENAKALSAVKDPQQAIELRTQYAQSTAEKMLACVREMAELASRTQAEVGKLVGEQLSTGGKDVFEAMQKMFTGMPITDQNAMTALQTAMDTTRSAFDQMTRASTEAFQMFTQQAPNAPKGKK